MRSVTKRVLFALVAIIGVVSTVYVIAANLPRSSGKSEPEASDISSIETEPKESLVPEEISEGKAEPTGQREPHYILICGTDNSHKLTDVIIAVKADPEQNRIAMLQIPRDTYVGDEYPTGKINAVCQQDGAKGLQTLLLERFSIRTDHYVIITPEVFRGVVDELGGIEMDVPRRIVFTEDRILEPGLQTLNGEKAEWFVRYRAGYVMGDIGRMQAQSLFLRALLKTAAEKNPAELALIAGHWIGNIETDITVAEALEMISLMPEELPAVRSEIVPGEGIMRNGFAVYLPDEERLAEMVREIFENKAHNPSLED